MKSIKNLHLASTAVTIIIVGLTYGIYPNKILPLFFDFKVNSTDLNNVFRAIMGLYLGMAVYWLIGIYNTDYWQSATVTSIFFMVGLAFGRIISMITAGIPSIPFTIGIILEVMFAIWGIYNLKKYNLKE